MKKYKIISGTTTHYVSAQNFTEANAEFRKTESGPIDYIGSVPVDRKKAIIQSAAAQGDIKVGVQRSLQMGYSDLPLFLEDKQTKLF